MAASAPVASTPLPAPAAPAPAPTVDDPAATPAAEGARRRQPRGQARIEQILDAATLVFAEKGYESTTTNAIAARAGISPGSLYQFFANKEAIAEGLAERYVREMGSVDAEALGGLDGLPLDEALNLAIDRLVAANLRDPGLKALLARTDMPPQMEAATASLHEAVRGRVELLLASRCSLSPEYLRVRSGVVMQISKALMVPICGADEGPERDVLVAELKRVLYAYLSSPV
jgi:AcrR family transcriptional regulator